MAIKASDSQYKEALQAYEQKKENLRKNYFDILKKTDNTTNGIALQKNTSNLFRVRKEAQHKIDVRNFNKVLKVDKDNLIAEIEGMTTYEDIVNETLKYDCLPTVVPELKSITIGGALSGVAIESSSFKYGLVHETIVEYELFLSDGRCIVCRPDNEHKELYFGFPNTYGTLGYALKVKVKLIPVKKFVKLTHTLFTEPKAYFEYLNEICLKNRKPDAPIAYIDGVVFNDTEMYVTTGEFTDQAPFISDYTFMNIFYKSIQKKKIDYLTTLDYIWRWDTDWFWCSKNFYLQNPILRFLLGKCVLKSTTFWKIRNFFNRNKLAKKIANILQGQSETIIQDIEVPVEKATAFLMFFNKEIGIKPIWICPVMPYQADVQYSFYKMPTHILSINFGFWDIVKSDQKEGFYNRKIERKVQELGGNKSLYSNVYYTLEEFWIIYDRSLYLNLKQKYDPQNKLKNLYDKCLAKNLNYAG